LAVLKCVKIREFYEFFKIRKMRILELWYEYSETLVREESGINVRVPHCRVCLVGCCRWRTGIEFAPWIPWRPTSSKNMPNWLPVQPFGIQS